MVEQLRAETVTDKNFRLLSAAALINKVKNGISVEELHKDAERKFDTLIEILSDTFTDNAVLSERGYSVADLKQISLLIFNRLISASNPDPYITLCALEGSSLKEIKRRRNKLLHIFHPDRNWYENSDGTKTRKINEAYDKIVNECNKTDIPFAHKKINIPPPYPYKKRTYNNRLILILIVITLIIAFFMFMKKIIFF